MARRDQDRLLPHPACSGGFLAEVWVINADGSGRTRLFRSDCCMDDWGGPVWSPDGRQVALVVNEGPGGRLIVVDARRYRPHGDHRTRRHLMEVAARPGSTTGPGPINVATTSVELPASVWAA